MKKLLNVGSTEWFHTNELTRAEIEELTKKYDLHDIIIEDMEEMSAQDKVDVYDDCLFLVLHFPKFEGDRGKYTMNEFNCILGKNYIVTITKYRTSFIEKIKQEYTDELQEDKDDGYEASYKFSPYYILYRIIDAMYDKTLRTLRNFTVDLVSIETNIFDQTHADAQNLEDLMKKRRSVVTLKHSINPQSEIVTELQKETVKLFGGQLEVYFEDLLYKVDKIMSHIHILQEDIDSLYDTANTMSNVRINKTMKVFTIFTAIIGVMTLVSGLYGMNVPLPGMESPYMFGIILLIMTIIIISLLWYFRHKNRLK